jgi:AraC-like DNA-binding protein
MGVLLISGVVLAFLFSAIIMFKKKNKIIADNILSVWLVFLGLDYLRSYFLFVDHKMLLLGFGYTLPAIYAPLLFMYVYSLTSKKPKFNMRLLYHLIPFVLINIYFLFFIYIKSPEEKQIFFYETTFSSRPVLFNFIQILMILIYPVYIVWIYCLLKKHIKNIKHNFSCEEKIDLHWINYLLLSVSVLWVVISLIKLLSGYYDTLYYNDTLITVYYFELIIIIIIGYFGFNQGAIFMNFPEPEVQTVNNIRKYKSTGLSSEDAKLITPKVLEYMTNEKPYLDSELSLIKLAGLLYIPSHHLSQIINEQLGKNFFEFINEYRVEEVKLLMAKNKDRKYTLLSIAYDRGFNSKSTFNSIFKKYTGITPKQYMNTGVLG